MMMTRRRSTRWLRAVWALVLPVAYLCQVAPHAHAEGALHADHGQPARAAHHWHAGGHDSAPDAGHGGHGHVHAHAQALAHAEDTSADHGRPEAPRHHHELTQHLDSHFPRLLKGPAAPEAPATPSAPDCVAALPVAPDPDAPHSMTGPPDDDDVTRPTAPSAPRAPPACR